MTTDINFEAVKAANKQASLEFFAPIGFATCSFIFVAVIGVLIYLVHDKYFRDKLEK